MLLRLLGKLPSTPLALFPVDSSLQVPLRTLGKINRWKYSLSHLDVKILITDRHESIRDGHSNHTL